VAPDRGERLRTLRLLMGMSQAELAAAAGVTQGLISLSEKGTRTTTDDLLGAVASATGTPASFFDVDPDELPTDTLHFRKKTTASAKEVKRVEATVREAYRVAARLIAATRVRRTVLPCAEGELDGEDIEMMALKTRDALGVGRDGPMMHITRACERAGIPVVPLILVDAHGQGEDVLVGHSGVSCWRGPTDPYLISYFAASSGDRQRFTVAHELGHLVLHITRRTIPAAQAEAEAHRFAGALLLPEERAREAFDGTFTLRDLALLKQRWGVSIQDLVERAHRLGAIDDERRTSLSQSTRNSRRSCGPCSGGGSASRCRCGRPPRSLASTRSSCARSRRMWQAIRRCRSGTMW
jgi:Zn-dependent peptidase ImmA (M78 family)/transcriptional regulator with XRE-family HTH domain